MVTVPGGLAPVPGVLYAQGESGLLGLAFHPNYSAPVGTTGRRKFYVNATTYNPSIFLPGNPTDGITHDIPGEPGEINDELDAINASPQLEQCFICDHQGDDLFAFVGPTGRMGFGCLTPAFKDASALNRTFTEIREYTVNEQGTDVVKDGLGNPEFRTIMRFQRRRDFHNGGTIAFATDGKLYISSGDSQGTPGEGLSTPHAQPQNPSADFFGKVLRIDVDSNLDVTPTANGTVETYSIPNNNPFKDPTNPNFTSSTAADDAVFAYGMRNPWKMSVDRVAGDLWIGDVGWGSDVGGAEEVNVVPESSGGGQNFGWPRFEGGVIDHDPDGERMIDPPPPYNSHPDVDPAHFYSTTQSVRGSITGGHVYRGPDPTLQGRYIFYESIQRQVWSYNPATDTAENITDKVFDDINNNGRPDVNGDDVGLLASFGEDSEGNLYLLSHSDGDIYGLSPAIRRQVCPELAGAATSTAMGWSTRKTSICWQWGPARGQNRRCLFMI